VPIRVSGQTGYLTVNGLNGNPTFGVSRCRLKTNYTNADVTVTAPSAAPTAADLGNEEFIPICRGRTYEIECPFDASIAPMGLEAYFESIMFPAAAATLPTVQYQIKTANGTVVRSYSGLGMLENYEIDTNAKDAVRVTFTIRMTGKVTIV
jgi:hypothetical protein